VADTVYSIGIGTTGTGFSDLDEPLLQQIAKAPGQYIHVTEASNLPNIFLDIFKDINICLPPTATPTPAPAATPTPTATPVR
jgi:hypothetical protein